MLSRKFRLTLSISAAAVALCAGTAATVSVTHAATAASAGAVKRGKVVATRRLTESQYQHTIADIFGRDIKLGGRFEPERREGLLLAIGASQLSISSAGFEQYYAMARGIADQVLDEKHRARTMPCQPADPKLADAKCTDALVRKYGRMLYRRPLTDAEVASRVKLAEGGSAAKSGDYYSGAKLALVSLMTSPQFLFRIETAANSKTHAVDPYTKAERIAFLLWDAAPDEALLQAAEHGELDTQAGVDGQVARLVASPRLEDGVRSFFSDMMQLDLFETVSKDATIYPKFSQQVAASAKEQTLKTVVDQLLTKDGDYRELLTSRATFIDRTLAAIYQVPFTGVGGWIPYRFGPESDRAGLLTEVTFLSLFSHPGRSSPTKRGVAVHEVFLCDPTPLPPANVDFSIVNNVNDPTHKTVRSRLLAHALDDSCSGCHNRSDPIGLSLERFDSLGQSRTHENGDVIDVSAELGGKKFEGAGGLSMVLKDNPRVPACLVRNVYAYGLGREPGNEDKAYLDTQTEAFAQDGYRLKSLLTRIASSPSFFQAPQAPALKSTSRKIATNAQSRVGARSEGGIQ